MKLIFKLLLLSGLVFQTTRAGDDFLKREEIIKRNQTRIADAIEKIPASEVRLFLYSLDPNDVRRFEGNLPENSDKSFHRIPILGKVEIIPLQEKTNLLGALASGVRESDGMVAMCFDPRHGLRVATKSATNDFVICFTCLQIQAYGFAPSENLLTGGSPVIEFNKFLDKYNIKKAKIN